MSSASEPQKRPHRAKPPAIFVDRTFRKIRPDDPAEARVLRLDLRPYRDPDLKLFRAREDGAVAREELGLDALDESPDFDKIVLRFPADTFAVTTSFFLGLLEPSIRRLGRDRFLDRYGFYGGIRTDDIRFGIDMAMFEQNPSMFRENTGLYYSV